MRDIPFNRLPQDREARYLKIAPEVKSKTGYGYFWNDINITSEILSNQLPPFVCLRFSEIEVRKL